MNENTFNAQVSRSFNVNRLFFFFLFLFSPYVSSSSLPFPYYVTNSDVVNPPSKILPRLDAKMETRVTFATQVTLFCEPQSKHIEVNRTGRPQTRCLILLTESLRD